MRAMLIALPFLTLFYDRDSLWLTYSGMIPGAVAIRAIGRVVLILLVPAALGLACLVEYLDRRRWAVASWIVVLRVPGRARGDDARPSTRRRTGRRSKTSRAGSTRPGRVLLSSPRRTALSIAITWTRCGRRWQPECRPSTAIRDTRPVPGIASSKPISIPKLTWRAPWPIGSNRTDFCRITSNGSGRTPGVSGLTREGLSGDLRVEPSFQNCAPSPCRRVRYDDEPDRPLTFERGAGRVYNPGKDEVERDERDLGAVLE